MRRAPPEESGTISRRTPFCAGSLKKAQRVRRAPLEESGIISRRTPFCAGSLKDGGSSPSSCSSCVCCHPSRLSSRLLLDPWPTNAIAASTCRPTPVIGMRTRTPPSNPPGAIPRPAATNANSSAVRLPRDLSSPPNPSQPRSYNPRAPSAFYRLIPTRPSLAISPGDINVLLRVRTCSAHATCSC